MIGIVLTIFLIGMIIWKKCCSKSNPTEVIPPADSKPTSETSCNTGDQQPGHQNQMHQSLFISTSYEETPRRKGEILEQYSKPHQRQIEIKT